MQCHCNIIASSYGNKGCQFFRNQWEKNLYFGGHKNFEALVLICLGEAQFYSKHQYLLDFGTGLSDQYHSLERLLSTSQI